MSVVPYLLNVVNFTFYPRYLDGVAGRRRNLAGVMATFRGGLTLCTGDLGLRNLILENVCFEGVYSVAKDYLQPLLKAVALAAPILLSQADRTRTAVLVAVVYATLNLLSSVASRQSHRAAAWAGDERRLSAWIWVIALGAYAIAGGGMLAGIAVFPTVAFVLLAVLLNVWKPVFVSRFHDSAEPRTAATTLSIANQSKTLAVAFLAPVLGMVVDRVAADSAAMVSLWPVALCGAAFSLLGLVLHGRKRGG